MNIEWFKILLHLLLIIFKKKEKKIRISKIDFVSLEEKEKLPRVMHNTHEVPLRNK